MNGQILVGIASGERVPVAIWKQPDGRITFTADASIDVDGSGDSHGDPYYQPDTSLHRDGEPLNSDVERYIVVPPSVVKFVVPVVLGCLAKVTYRGKTVDAVVGDIGPSRRSGEISYSLARALNINPNPINGGVDEIEVTYEIFPGVAALVDGVQYQLQPS